MKKPTVPQAVFKLLELQTNTSNLLNEIDAGGRYQKPPQVTELEDIISEAKKKLKTKLKEDPQNSNQHRVEFMYTVATRREKIRYPVAVEHKLAKLKNYMVVA